MADPVPQVGAPDPELETSPIFDEYDEMSLDQELETGACYFNGVAYPIGQFVRSGEDVLRCVRRGVWVRWGEVPPECRQPVAADTVLIAKQCWRDGDA